jgi:putative aldouronate transport system substrate-binding protein
MVDDEGDPNKTLIPVFESATNVKVDYMVYPYNIAMERKNILLASGDYPDVIAGWLLIQDEVIRLSEEGVLIPLTDLIENYTVNIKEALEFPGVREAMTHPDGEIYTIPYIIGERLVTFNPWINVQWLDQLGLPMPATTEELKNTLIAFRDRIRGPNNQRVIPFSASPNNLRLGTLAGWFGVNAYDYFAMIDGKLEITITKPEYREFVRYFADLWANGLIDQELFSQDEQTWKAKGMQGLYGVNFGYGPGDFAPPLKDDVTVNRYAYEALPVLRAPNVETPVYRRASFGHTIFRTQAAITDKAVNPLTIIRWFDFLYDEARSFESYWGQIGIRFEQLPDGTFRETANGRTEEAQKAVDPTFFWALPRFIRPGNKVLPPEGMLPEYNHNDIRDALYAPYLEEQMIPTAWTDRSVGQKIAQLTEAIKYYHDQKLATWVTGNANVDNDWDTYLAELDRLGINELLEIRRGVIGNR